MWGNSNYGSENMNIKKNEKEIPTKFGIKCRFLRRVDMKKSVLITFWIGFDESSEETICYMMWLREISREAPALEGEESREREKKIVLKKEANYRSRQRAKFADQEKGPDVSQNTQ